MKGGKSKAESTKTDAKLKGKSVGVGKRGGKKETDPNKPKRPPSAFFVFMEEFRKQFKEEHPENKSVSVVGKAAGEKWKSMTPADKAPYVAKAEKRKTEYNKNMQTYNKKLAGGTNGAEDDESDKSKSEVHDEDEEEGSGDDDNE